MGDEVGGWGAVAQIEQGVRGAVKIEGGAVPEEKALNKDGDHEHAAINGIVKGNEQLL